MPDLPFSALQAERTRQNDRMPNETAELLRRAIAMADASRAAGNHPFGALLAVNNEVVSEAHNLVNTTGDITAHAESMLVRHLEGAGQLGLLKDGTVYASCEPCPMCVGALFWAGARHVVFGLSASRLNSMTSTGEPFGFIITAGEIGAAANPPMRFDGPMLEDEAAASHDGYWVTN